jgi:hypothetical protein
VHIESLAREQANCDRMTLTFTLNGNDESEGSTPLGARNAAGNRARFAFHTDPGSVPLTAALAGQPAVLPL